VPSFVLIRPTVWPQYTNVTDRQDRQTDRQRTDSIGRTVLQTFAQKSNFCPWLGLTGSKSVIVPDFIAMRRTIAELWRFNGFCATVCKTVRPMLSVRCLSVCLSVTFMHCGQTVGRIKMKLGVQVCYGPGHIVIGGDPAPPLLKGHSPQISAHICCGQMAA